MLDRTLSRRAALLGLAAAAAAPAAPALAAPKSRLIDARWRAHGDRDDVSHAAWTAFLQAHREMRADGVALIRYGAVGAADHAALKAYVATLSAAKPTTLTRPAAFAYWANLYNAVTIDLVLDAYPVESIREVKGGFFNTGPWGEKVVEVEGQALSLDDIEHGVMRPVLKDPRVHYAVNCASIGCPNLGPAAFEAATLERDLDALARAYVNHPRGARVEGGRLIVSSIYEWFQEDFGGTDAGVIAHLKQYAEPELAAALKGVGRIADDAYDWALNDA